MSVIEARKVSLHQAILYLLHRKGGGCNLDDLSTFLDESFGWKPDRDLLQFALGKLLDPLLHSPLVVKSDNSLALTDFGQGFVDGILSVEEADQKRTKRLMLFDALVNGPVPKGELEKLLQDQSPNLSTDAISNMLWKNGPEQLGRLGIEADDAVSMTELGRGYREGYYYGLSGVR